MGTSQRLQARIRPRQADQLAAFASEHMLTTSAAVRVLLARALDEDASGAGQQVALASLIAAEHALLVLSSMFPEGDRRLREHAEAAVEAAERRLANLADRLGEVPA